MTGAGKALPPLRRLQTKGNQGLWQAFPQHPPFPALPQFAARPRGQKDASAPLPLQLGVAAFWPAGRKRCGYEVQEVSREGTCAPSALSPSFLLARFPATVLSNEVTLEMETTSSRSISEKGLSP